MHMLASCPPNLGLAMCCAPIVLNAFTTFAPAMSSSPPHALLVFRYEKEHRMPWRFGDEGIEARFGCDVEEGPRDRHLSHVAFQDRICLDRLDIEQSDPFKPSPTTQHHLSRSAGGPNPRNPPIGTHEPASPTFPYL